MLDALLFWPGDDGTELAVASRNSETAHSYANYAMGGEELLQVYGS